MGDRNNPIKFGPEWLRNLARERSAGSSASNSQTTVSTTSTTASVGTLGGSSGTMTASSLATASNTSNAANTSSKVQLAKLRYGREEMLALYDRTAQPPTELKFIDILYVPRGKPPFALNNSFEEEMRDPMRISGPLTGAVPGVDRFGIGRGMGRAISIVETRGRARLPFLRTPAAGRGNLRHLGNPRIPGYSGGTEDDTSVTLRSWNNNKGGSTPTRNPAEQPEWIPNKMYISKRSGNNTNWRQSRDEEEWRASDGNRAARSTQQDKWERDWGDRAPQDKPQSWSLNRRTWVGNDSQNSDDLPEWAVENAEACGGTFDSSGAFHGYSNDDSNLPKSQETAYALTRSHTHGSFVRSKTAEEGSEEWWASEKAKKLSPKRFDAIDIKFKKSNSVIPELSSGTSSSTELNANKEDAPNKVTDRCDSSPPAADHGDHSAGGMDDNYNKRNVRFAESKTFDALMRSDINLEEASDERGNFQSVMITPNNSLRQKHQNIVASVTNNHNRQNLPGILQLLQNSQNRNDDSDLAKQHSTADDKIVDKIMDLALEDRDIHSKLPHTTSDSMMSKPPPSVMSSTLASTLNSVSQMSMSAMRHRMSSPVHLSQGLAMNPKSSISNPGTQPIQLQTPIQNVGITSSALNASLGLTLGPSSNAMNQAMGLPMQGVPLPVLPNQGMPNSGVGPSVMQTSQGLPGFQSSGVIPGISGANVVNSSLFLGQSSNTPPLQSSNDMQMGHGNQNNMFSMHGLQHSGSQAAFNPSMYSSIMQQSPGPNAGNSQNLAEQWYYEDPKGQIQGPFTAKDMFNWYQAGFFSASLMVRRACDAHMRPLGSYGPVVPFQQMDMMSFPMPGGYESRIQGPPDSMLGSQQGLGLDVINMTENNSIDAMQFGTVGLIRNQTFSQQQMVDSLWSQPSPSADLLWIQQALNARNEARVNNLPMFFWDQQPSAISSNSLLPEDITKEMKTEDQILAQLRTAQNLNIRQNLPCINDPPSLPPPPADMPQDVFPSKVNVTPNMEELQKLIRDDSSSEVPVGTEIKADSEVLQVKMESVATVEPTTIGEQPVQNKIVQESKQPNVTKGETEKSAKNKENNVTKSKNNKKPKEEKKEEFPELIKTEEGTTKAEKRLEELSPTKNKKEDKHNKKELEKEKKEWLKEGFTIVKTEKTSKDNKKKTEEIKAVEEAERKRREEERLIAEEEKKNRQAESLKKQQEIQQQQQLRQAAESAVKKAPWSAAANQAVQATNKDGPTLAEIQRLEREKKLEQMKEQQQMMQIIAKQQAAALAREQEMQAGLGWAKKKGNLNAAGQSLAEIQAETRKQAAAAAAAAASQALEDIPVSLPPQTNHAPWGTSHNGGGFWDTQPNPSQKPPQEVTKTAEHNKSKKKPTVVTTKKDSTPKDSTPTAEFETWCTTVLTSWSAKIDVPTFVGFLKDIESPYEVKDYVKCYLGDTKDSSDFARQFLERRSKLLRVGMVTPSDDLCSPAMAVNPRTTSGSDYQESKSKKTKKSKMLKVDNRILGFSVTASEDRINVGDIDSV